MSNFWLRLFCGNNVLFLLRLKYAAYELYSKHSQRLNFLKLGQLADEKDPQLK